MRRFFPLLLLLTTATQAADAVYRWVDKDGVVHYSAQSPNKDAKPASLPPLQTYSHKTGPQNLLESTAPAQSAAATPPDATPPPELRITGPAPDEVFRDAQGLVPVAVSVKPFMPMEGGLVFYLDGSAQNRKPWASTSYTLVGVERGEHRVAAALVDRQGKEVTRSAAVTFYAKPPSIR